MRYDDMMGLEMYGDDLGAWMTPEMLKSSLMTGGAGGVGILATGYILQMESLNGILPEDAVTRSRVKNVLAIAIGVLGGRAIYGDGFDQARRDYAMGFVGGVAGLGVASLLASFLPADSEWASGLRTFATAGTGFSSYGGMRGVNLAALEAAVATNSPSWAAGEGMAALSAPVIRDQMLAGTGTTTEEIASFESYMNAPAPSF